MRLGHGGTATRDRRGADGTSETCKGMTTEFHKKSVGSRMHSAITENRHYPVWLGSSLDVTSRRCRNRENALQGTSLGGDLVSLPSSSFVILGKSIILSRPQFSYLK